LNEKTGETGFAPASVFEPLTDAASLEVEHQTTAPFVQTRSFENKNNDEEETEFVTTTTTTTKTIKTIKTIQTDQANNSAEETSAISKGSSSSESLQTLVEERTPASSLVQSTLDTAYKEYMCVQEFIPRKAGCIVLHVNDQILVYSILSDGFCHAYNLSTREKGLCPLDHLRESSFDSSTETISQAKTRSLAQVSVEKEIHGKDESLSRSKEVTTKKVEMLHSVESSNSDPIPTLDVKKREIILEPSSMSTSDKSVKFDLDSSISKETKTAALITLESRMPSIYRATRTRMALDSKELNLVAGSVVQVDLILSDGNCYAYVH
jgi:hypothetical protein